MATVRVRPLLLLLCVALAGGACGVSFGESSEGNEFFTGLDVTGHKVVGEPLTAAVAYETFYPMPVDITCDLYRGRERLREIGRTQAPAVPGDRSPEDEDERVPGNVSFDFAVEEAGKHEVECYTPLDDSNFIVESFGVAPR